MVEGQKLGNWLSINSQHCDLSSVASTDAQNSSLRQPSNESRDNNGSTVTDSTDHIVHSLQSSDHQALSLNTPQTALSLQTTNQRLQSLPQNSPQAANETLDPSPLSDLDNLVCSMVEASMKELLQKLLRNEKRF